jgi:acyl-CoA thioesterase I
MNPIALYLASGESLYAGAMLLMGVAIVSYRCKNRWLLRLRNLLGWMALGMIILACAPAAWWAYGVVIGGYLVWFVAENVGAWRSHRKARLAAALAAILPVAALCAVEWPRRQVAELRANGAERLCVIGDSISSGIELGYPPWPEIYAKKYGVEVVNLSRAGIGTEEAGELAARLPKGPAVVLVEIGGNDLLGGIPAGEFERNLELVLQRASGPERVVVMMELPLLPHVIEYGRVQRRLAQRLGVVMIPKREFVRVISGGDATSDGLHLSPAGTQRMAQLVYRVCGGAIGKTATSRP